MTRDRTKSYYRTKANKDPSHKTTNRHCQKRGTREDPEKATKSPGGHKYKTSSTTNSREDKTRNQLRRLRTRPPTGTKTTGTKPQRRREVTRIRPQLRHRGQRNKAPMKAKRSAVQGPAEGRKVSCTRPKLKATRSEVQGPH